jgi:hypothetical protein
MASLWYLGLRLLAYEESWQSSPFIHGSQKHGNHQGICSRRETAYRVHALCEGVDLGQDEPRRRSSRVRETKGRRLQVVVVMAALARGEGSQSVTLSLRAVATSIGQRIPEYCPSFSPCRRALRGTISILTSGGAQRGAPVSTF